MYFAIEKALLNLSKRAWLQIYIFMITVISQSKTYNMSQGKLWLLRFSLIKGHKKLTHRDVNKIRGDFAVIIVTKGSFVLYPWLVWSTKGLSPSMGCQNVTPMSLHMIGELFCWLSAIAKE